mgnify:CR=1 FL=1
MLFDKPRVHNGVSDPVGLVFIYDFLEDVVERFVGLRIVRHTSFMYYHIEVCQAFYYLSEEMSTLITYELNRTTVSAPNVFI